jgi:hypothetical protein
MERAKLPGGESDLDRPMSRLSVLPPSEVAGPSANDLRLGRRVLDLEKERDVIIVRFANSIIQERAYLTSRPS